MGDCGSTGVSALSDWPLLDFFDAFLGPLSGVYGFFDADAQAWGAVGDSRFGASVAVLADTNGDGGDELVVGAPKDAQTGEERGAVDLLSFAETP